jgi:hypothetical protein
MPEPASEQSLFLRALELPTPADRAAYLDEACRDNPGLRADLDALLAAHDRLGGGQPRTTGQEPAGHGPGARRSGPSCRAGTSWWSCSARGAWGPSGWRSRRSRCGGWWR